MANPTKPKEAKPRVEGEDTDNKKPVQASVVKEANPLVTGIIIAVVVALGMSAVNYVMINQMFAKLPSKIAVSSESADEVEEEDGDEPTVERGVILDLGDFILNLADKDAKHFLKLNVAVELSKKDSEIAPKAAPAEKEAHGGHGGHGGEEPAVEAPSVSSLEKEMNQYKPAIRDAVISILSGKTSDELATTPGKELAKEQIKESVNSVFDGEREVLRVSFGSFFIQ